MCHQCRITQIISLIFRVSPQTKAIQRVLLYKCFVGDMCPKSVQSGPCDNKALCSILVRELFCPTPRIFLYRPTRRIFAKTRCTQNCYVMHNLRNSAFALEWSSVATVVDNTLYLLEVRFSMGLGAADVWGILKRCSQFPKLNKYMLNLRGEI